MTRIDFYIHVDNQLHTLCTLAAKALAKDVRMMILTPDRADDGPGRQGAVEPTGHRLPATLPR